MGVAKTALQDKAAEQLERETSRQLEDILAAREKEKMKALLLSQDSIINNQTCMSEAFLQWEMSEREAREKAQAEAAAEAKAKADENAKKKDQEDAKAEAERQVLLARLKQQKDDDAMEAEKMLREIEANKYEAQLIQAGETSRCLSNVHTACEAFDQWKESPDPNTTADAGAGHATNPKGKKGVSIGCFL